MASTTKKRATASTVANHESSRAHLVIRFESRETEMPCGLLIDTTGPERSANIAQLDRDMTRESTKIGNDNICIPKLLEGVVAGKDITVYKG